MMAKLSFYPQVQMPPLATQLSSAGHIGSGASAEEVINAHRGRCDTYPSEGEPNTFYNMYDTNIFRISPTEVNSYWP